MRYVIIAILALFLVAACGPVETDANEKYQAPSAPEEPEPVVKEVIDEAPPELPLVENEEKPSDIFAGEDIREESGSIQHIICDAEERTLSFTVYNDGDRSWDLDQAVSFPPPPDMIGAKVFINNYEANKKTPNLDFETGEMLFGPSEMFSENCGGVARIAPGDAMECSLTNVPLKGAETYDTKNKIWVDVPGDIEPVIFTC